MNKLKETIKKKLTKQPCQPRNLKCYFDSFLTSFNFFSKYLATVANIGKKPFNTHRSRIATI